MLDIRTIGTERRPEAVGPVRAEDGRQDAGEFRQKQQQQSQDDVVLVECQKVGSSEMHQKSVEIIRPAVYRRS